MLFRSPQAVLDLKSEVMLDNDPAMAFWDEFGDEFVWDLLPNQFLYDLYVAWWKRTNPSGTALSKTRFLKQISDMMASKTDEWEYTPSARSQGKMDEPETLIAEYKLESWFNPSYTGTDPLRKSLPRRATTYRGYLRKAPRASWSTEQDYLAQEEESVFGP